MAHPALLHAQVSLVPANKCKWEDTLAFQEDAPPRWAAIWLRQGAKRTGCFMYNGGGDYMFSCGLPCKARVGQPTQPLLSQPPSSSSFFCSESLHSRRGSCCSSQPWWSPSLLPKCPGAAAVLNPATRQNRLCSPGNTHVRPTRGYSFRLSQTEFLKHLGDFQQLPHTDKLILGKAPKAQRRRGWVQSCHIVNP